MSLPLLSVEIRYEHDVVLARRRARQVAEALGFGRQDQYGWRPRQANWPATLFNMRTAAEWNSCSTA